MKNLSILILTLLLCQSSFARDPKDEQEKVLDSTGITIKKLKESLLSPSGQVKDAKRIMERSRFSEDQKDGLSSVDKVPEDENRAPKDDQSYSGGTSR